MRLPGSVNRRIIEFAPHGPDDVDMAEIATTYTDHVVLDQNPGPAIFEDVIHDGLTARLGVVQVYWDEREERTTGKFNGWTQDDVLALIDREPGVDLGDDLTMDETGALTRPAPTRWTRSRRPTMPSCGSAISRSRSAT